MYIEWPVDKRGHITGYHPITFKTPQVTEELFSRARKDRCVWTGVGKATVTPGAATVTPGGAVTVSGAGAGAEAGAGGGEGEGLDTVTAGAGTVTVTVTVTEGEVQREYPLLPLLSEVCLRDQGLDSCSTHPLA